MKRLIPIVLVCLLSAAIVSAQTATPQPAGEPANPRIIEGTLAYWSFFPEGVTDGEAVPAEGMAVADLSGNGNDLMRMNMPEGQETDMTWSVTHAENMPTAGSLRLVGDNTTQIGAYLSTAEEAPLNMLTFEDGFTIEVFVMLPEDWTADANQWTGILSRGGTGETLGRSGEGVDPDEGVGYLGVSNFPEFQWQVFPLNLEAHRTNWSDQLMLGEWYHVAIVNDGARTLMFLNGEEVLRNPAEEVIGIATAELPWRVGANAYGDELDTFNGWIGDIRIVDRAIGFDEFLTAEIAQ